MGHGLQELPAPSESGQSQKEFREALPAEGSGPHCGHVSQRLSQDKGVVRDKPAPHWLLLVLREFPVLRGVVSRVVWRDGSGQQC